MRVEKKWLSFCFCMFFLNFAVANDYVMTIDKDLSILGANGYVNFLCEYKESGKKLGVETYVIPEDTNITRATLVYHESFKKKLNRKVKVIKLILTDDKGNFDVYYVKRSNEEERMYFQQMAGGRKLFTIQNENSQHHMVLYFESPDGFQYEEFVTLLDDYFIPQPALHVDQATEATTEAVGGEASGYTHSGAQLSHQYNGSDTGMPCNVTAEEHLMSLLPAGLLD